LKTRCLATTALLLLPAAAAGEQFDYGVTTQGGWSSNVYGNSDDATIFSAGRFVPLDEVDDYSVRVSPWGKFSDVDGNLTWEAQYKPSYEYYLQESDIRGFDHEAAGQVYWRVGPRTTLIASDSYREYRSLFRFNENAADPTEAAALRAERTEITGNLASVALRHVLTPLDELSFNGQYVTRRYDTANDIDSLSVGANWRHSLDARTTVGLRASWTEQTFTRTVGDDQVTDYYNISATFEHRFSRTLSLELYAGPAWIDPNAELVNFSRRFGAVPVAGSFVAVDADGCRLLNEELAHQPNPDLPNYNPHLARPNFGGCAVSGSFLTDGELELLGYPRGDPLTPGSGAGAPRLAEFSQPYELTENGELVEVDDSDFGQTEFTYFARAAIVKDWERWHGELAYTRSSDDSGSIGTSSVRDTIEAVLRWDAARLWSVTMTAGYSIFDQAGDFAVPEWLVVQNEAVPPGVDTVSQIATVQRFVVDVDDDALNFTTWNVSLAARRRLTLHSSAFVALYWYQQSSERDLDEEISFIPGVSNAVETSSTTDNLTIWFGLDWKFDTIKF
jgi:hypothetical protein